MVYTPPNAASVVREIANSSYHPVDWDDAQLPDAHFPYNNSVSAATRLGPNEVGMG